jgi:D-aspartate ligase
VEGTPAAAPCAEALAMIASGIPAVLLGGINLVRALGLARIPVIVATPDRDAPATKSRYCSEVCELPPIAQAPAVAERLLRTGARLHRELGRRIPLFYGDDDYLGIVQDFRAALSEHYAFLLNDAALARALHSKALFQALAERRGLPIPTRLDWESLEQFQGEVLIKPSTKTDWATSAVQHRLFGGVGKARVFSSGRAARQNSLVQRLAGDLTFQEYVPGDDRSLWSFHGFADESSEILEWFTGRKIRTYPQLTGDSSYLELESNATLETLGRDIVRRLGLKGVFKIDFKRHAHTGKFHILEVNARFNLWHYLGAKNGVNLAGVAYDYVTRGVRPQHVAARTDYRWLCARLDFKAFQDTPSLSLAGWVASLVGSRKVYDTFAWNDPMPFLAELRRTELPQLKRKVLRWLSTAS